MRELTFLVVLLACIGLAGTARADECKDAYYDDDFQRALLVCRKAAEQGLVTAQFNLGWMYNHGQGVTQDYDEAAKWYRKAAEQDHAGAQHNLGLMYEAGRGVTKDYAEAIKWYRKAAEQGLAATQFMLGQMYRMGRGVTQDFVKAHALFNISAAQGQTLAAEESRAIVASEMTREDISKAQELARECAEKDYKNCGF